MLFVLQSFNKLLNSKFKSENIIQNIWENYKPIFEKDIKIAIKDMEDMINIYKGRGLLEHAMDFLSETYNNLLKKRLEAPFFDLKPFSKNELNMEQLMDLFREIAPCNAIIQNNKEDYDEICKDILISFTGNSHWKDTGFTQTDFLRTLQCQLHYLQSHLELGKDKFVSSNKVQTKSCPFYTICKLNNRKNNSKTCKNKPWEVFKENKSNTCWYGSAVSSTLGDVNIDK